MSAEKFEKETFLSFEDMVYFLVEIADIKKEEEKKNGEKNRHS